MERIYMDHSATTPVSERALEAMLPWFREEFGNPSAIYSYGQTGKNILEDCRKRMARCLGALQTEIVFTSGGTESDNWAIRGACRTRRSRGRHIITTAIEHNAVLRTLAELEEDGFTVTRLIPDRRGQITPEQLEAAIRPDTILITIMLANNVVGTVLDIPALSRVAAKHRIWFHTDAVQAAGHIRVNAHKLGVDFLSLSAHKFGGPKGVGALYCRLPNHLAPILTGGGQEKGLRSGTENIPGIVGMTAALEESVEELDSESARLTVLRDRLIEGACAIPGVSLTGDSVSRLPGFASFVVEGIGHSAHLVNALNEKGICVSSGSACSAASREASHVLLALGYGPEEASGTLRITLGRENTSEQVETLLSLLPDTVERLRREATKERPVLSSRPAKDWNPDEEGPA